jgi:hypothetical protein
VGLGIYGALGVVAGLAFLILTGTETLEPDHATAFWILSLVLFVIPFGSWMLLHLWIYMDAERRDMNGVLWALLSFLLCFVGPIVYLLVRGPRRAPCPACGARVAATDSSCRHCGQPLRIACARCGGVLQSTWRVCPACGTPTAVESSGLQAGIPPGP